MVFDKPPLQKYFQNLSILLQFVRRVNRAQSDPGTRIGIPNPKELSDMRFMVMVKADKSSEAGVLPSEKLLADMGKYNEELVKAGILLAAEGLQPSSKGARVRFSGTKRTVIDGPFAETKELIAGFWLIEVKSKEEAIEWAKRVPFEQLPGNGRAPEIELRQMFELADFPDVPPAVAEMEESFQPGRTRHEN